MADSSYVRLQRIVYETICDPPEGYRIGEIVTGLIMTLIAVNVIMSILETEETVYELAPDLFYYFEFVSVVIFTVEYILMIWSCTVFNEYNSCFVGRIKAILRPMAIVDVLAIAPFYLNLALENNSVDLRFLRTLRLFRLIRLFRHSQLSEAFKTLLDAVKSKQRQLGMGMAIYILIVLICSSIMFIIESGVENTKFTSIPASLWWGVVTMTTIGYGDMVPESTLGKVFASIVAYLGLCSLALPVGILGAGFIKYTDLNNPKKASPQDTAQEDDISSCCNSITQQQQNQEEQQQIRHLLLTLKAIKDVIQEKYSITTTKGIIITASKQLQEEFDYDIESPPAPNLSQEN
mmetsp:Transcript_24043/g.27392  ORF Transcript_24043/g.27392 Transcript_24043/m.27392 type:complete len:349 (+) Transcript_24043:61-1107(+)